MVLVKFEDYIHPGKGYFQDYIIKVGFINHRINGKDYIKPGRNYEKDN